MEKSLKIIFYTFLIIFCLGCVYLTTVMYLSPRQDADERGFIPCTKQLVINLQDCAIGSIGCPFKLLAKDMQCNIGVVYTGFALWVSGKQSTPWANYLFEPKLYVDGTSTDNVPDVARIKQEMSDMDAKNRFIERKHKELEEAKHRQLHLNENILLYDPENPIIDTTHKPLFTNDKSGDIPQGDIADEAFVETGEPTDNESIQKAAPTKPNVVDKIRSTNAEKLQKGNMKDEK